MGSDYIPLWYYQGSPDQLLGGAKRLFIADFRQPVASPADASRLAAGGECLIIYSLILHKKTVSHTKTNTVRSRESQ